MRPCSVVYLLLLFFVLKVKSNENYFGNFGQGIESHPDFHVEFNPSSMLAFVPGRSCHLQFRGDHGTFSPPVFYGSIDVNLWCNWTVVAAPDKHIVIYITGFQTNKTCSENHDEIIFEGISSSVENTIVYACWNKRTHVFATQARAVSVVLLWRSFPYRVSNRYFEGRYYVFDDPVLGQGSGNCSLTTKQNISTNNVIQAPIPKTTPTTKSYVYSVLPPSFSSSIPHIPEAHLPQEPPTIMETDKSTLTMDHLLTVDTHEEDMLHVTRTLAQSLPTIYNTSKIQLPAETQSLESGGHTVLPTVEDLDPSHVGKWETMSQSIWTWEAAHSEFLSETPSLISTPIAESIYVSTVNVKELQKGQHSTPPFFSIDGLTGLDETPQFSTTHTVTFQEASYFDKANVPESQQLSRTDFIEPLQASHFVLAQAAEPLEPSLIHILNTEFPEPSLVSHVSYSSKFTETSQLSKDQTTKKVNMTHVSVAHDSELSKTLNINVDISPELPETLSFISTKYTETVLSNVSTIHHIDFPAHKPDDLEPPEVHQLTVTNNGDLSEMQHISVVHAIEQSELLNPAGSAQLQILLTKLPLTNNTESYPKEPVLDYPWQVEPSPPTPYSDSTEDISLTETSVSELLGLVAPLQVSEQSFQPTFVSDLHPPFIPAKSPNGILGKTDNANDDKNSDVLSKVSLSSTAPPLFPSRTSILGFQMMRSTYRTTVEQTLDPSSPQRPAVTSDQQLMLESSVALHPTPEMPTKLIYSTSALQMTEKDQIVIENEYTSPKSLETLSSPTTDHKVARSLTGPKKDLDQWTVKNNVEATDYVSRTSTRPLGMPVSDLSFSEQLSTGNTFLNGLEDLGPQDSHHSQPLLQPTENSRSNVDIATIEVVSEGNEKSTYSYQTNSDIDFYPDSLGQPRDNYLDEQDVTHFFENQTDLEFRHEPGDSLFVITTEIEHKAVVLKDFQKELIKSVREKIAEKLIYFPSGVNSLIIREFGRTSLTRATLTFWLQLFQGGKEMRNFLKSQLRTLEKHPIEPFNAKLISFTVEDVNECQTGMQNCHSNAHCVNMIGSYSCSCMVGYEDHSPTAPGTLCILPKPAEIHSLSEHLEILIAAIVTVAVAVLFIIIILCIVQKRRRVKVNLQDPPTSVQVVHSGGDHHGESGQPPSSPTRHISSRHGRDHHTARETSSTLELTKITIEQTAC